MPTGCAFSVLPWQLLSVGSTASPFTLRPIATYGMRLIGTASARLAMMSSSGAVAPEFATPRNFALREALLHPGFLAAPMK